ncbi:mitochondrial amidoxime-reducing component 1 isoform X7 [Nycticebus coucang]|uniref:mitochondrial amidoxime-reducing component 1 isoform X7 n=1 Tax=Nycticebus coucang TaxID=9470 RepID=UPI00234C7DA3|nr:mitochondrial amidoxime-reducing component 1 isoform X7 [Nycticebus coucang]
MGAGSSALARLGLPAPRLLARPGSGWLGVAVLGMAAVVLGAVAWLRGRSRRRRRLQQVGAVAQLWIYPVKSCKGVPVSSAECTAMGLRSGHLRDRVHGLEIEGRDCGEAAAQWITSFLKTQPYRLVHFEPHMRPRHPQQIKDLFPAKERIAYPDASPFLILSEASLADLNSRLEKKVKATNFRPNIIISGCGVYAETQTCFFPPVLCALPIPGLVLLQCSPPGIIRWKEDSHAHLARSEASGISQGGFLKEVRFHENLSSQVNELTYLKREGTRRCVNTCWLPRTEDSWDVLRIGDVELKRVMACSRCILTTVDPDTGIMSRKEPLETLKSYRKCDPSEQKLYGKSPLFGQYFVLENPGTIKVGDPVYLLSQ